MTRIVRGLAALVALLAIIAGIPALLLALGADALPSSVPSLTEVKLALTTPDSGQLFIGFLVIVAWIAWAYFTLSILVELAVQLTRRPHLRIPGMNFGRAQVSGLVAAVAAVLAVAPAASAMATPVPLTHETATTSHTQTVAPPAQAQPHAPKATTQHTADGGGAATEAPATAAAAPASAQAPHAKPAAKHHRVQSGETLWGLAEHYYGEGKGPEYKRIVAANPGVDEDAWLEIGQILTIPGVAADQATKPASHSNAKTPPHTDKVVTVERGDTLSEIAQEELGDGNQWPKIADKSRSIVQPDGHRLTDPDLIQPGWKMVVPGAGAEIHRPEAKTGGDDKNEVKPPTPVKPVEPTVKPSAKPTPEATTKPTAQPTQQATSKPTSVPTQLPTTVPTQQPVTPSVTAQTPQAATPSPEVTANAGQTQDDTDRGIIAHPVQTAAGAGALLCAGLLGLVAVRRRRQLRRREPGQQIPQLPEEFAAVEHEMRTVARPVTREQVNRALRTLAHMVANSSNPELPRLQYMLHTDDRIILHFDTPRDAPSPFIADGNTWSLDRDDVDQLIDTQTASTVPAPYPALITIGSDADDNFVLVDLEHLAALTLKVETGHAEGVLAAIATELATSLWADDLLVTIVGAHQELPAAIGTDRARYLATPAELLTSLRNRLRTDRAQLAAAGHPNACAARREEPSDWPPEVILLGTELSADEQAELTQMLTDVPRVAVAVVSAMGEPISDWVLTATSPTAAELHPVGLTIAPQMLRDADYTAALQMLQLSQRADTTPAPWWDHSMDTPTEDEGHDEPALPPVAILSQHTSRPVDQTPASTAVASFSMPTPIRVAIPDTAAPQETEPAANAPIAADNAENAADTEQAADTADEHTHDAGTSATVHTFPTPVPSLTLFGHPAVHNPAGDVVDQARIGQLTRAAVWLSLNPNHTTAEMDKALSISSDTRASIISRLRKWLGENPDGELYVPKLGRRVGLHEDVRSDWDRLQDLIVGGVNATATVALAEALRLVTGPPIAEPDIDRYDFASNDRDHITAVVRDTALTLAERSIASGDIDQARAAIAKGCLIDPDDESFARAEIRVERLAGNMRRVQEIVNRLTTNARRRSIDLEDKTVALLNDLKRALG